MTIKQYFEVKNVKYLNTFSGDKKQKWRYKKKQKTLKCMFFISATLKTQEVN